MPGLTLTRHENRRYEILDEIGQGAMGRFFGRATR